MINNLWVINGIMKIKYSIFHLHLMVLLFHLHCCSSLNSEGMALLRFKESVVKDPYNALYNWAVKDGDLDHCSWFGVHCSDGKVVTLNLKDLCLGGTLASELGTLTHIKSIILRNNSFSGNIPDEIANLKELEVLDLGYNDFSGPLPSNLGNSFSLSILLLDNNNDLSLSPELSHLQMLSEHQVDENQLRGVSADSSCKSKYFSWYSSRPDNFTGRSLLQVQNLHPHSPDSLKRGSRPVPPNASSPVHAPFPAPSRSQNHTSRSAARSPLSSQSPSPSPTPAPAPAPFSSQSQSLSLSPSPAPASFSSPVPSPSPSSAPAGPSFSPSEIPSMVSESPAPAPAPAAQAARVPVTHSAFPTSPNSHHHKVIIWASASGGAAFLILSALAIFVCKSSKVGAVKPWATGLSGQLQRAFVSGVPKLKRAELELACEDFSNIIGSLNDGTVYKGTLSSGTEIAVVESSVKSLEQWSKKLEGQFRKKIETLSKVNHKNFVNLIGYCEEAKPFTRMMVFEYAPNGTLFEHLHIKEAERLDWRMRLRVIMGMAYCLEHMHQLNPPIPHRDLQSSSIYLSDDYAAKVSDFSFWTAGSRSKMRSPSKLLLEASLTDIESNVYNFGIVLLEMITGRMPYMEDNSSISDWVFECVDDEQFPRDMVDPTLSSYGEEEVQRLFYIARDCLKPDPRERPTLRDIAACLREITGMMPDAAIPKLSPLWWAELEVMSMDGA